MFHYFSFISNHAQSSHHAHHRIINSPGQHLDQETKQNVHKYFCNASSEKHYVYAACKFIHERCKTTKSMRSYEKVIRTYEEESNSENTKVGSETENSLFFTASFGVGGCESLILQPPEKGVYRQKEWHILSHFSTLDFKLK